MEEKKALLGSIEIPDSSVGLFDRLRWMFRLQAQFELQHPRLAKVAYRALYRELPFRDEMLEGLCAYGRAAYCEMIEHGICEGSIRPDIDPDIATYMLSTLFGELSRYLTSSLQLDETQMLTRKLSDDQWDRGRRGAFMAGSAIGTLFDHIEIFLVLSDLVGVDQLTIVIPTKVGIQLCLSGGSPPTRG